MVRNDRRAATSLPGLAGRSRDRSTAARWRTVWPDIMPPDADVAGPGQHRVRGELGAVIADDHLRRFATAQKEVDHEVAVPSFLTPEFISAIAQEVYELDSIWIINIQECITGGSNGRSHPAIHGST